ncbi:hypothetical protein TW86_11355 [Halomonas sp. S2151]|uniref:hypothetical protein n=1 Tax=Halomonas sp. S2151 TaxID=579478 RepID=UPI0005FA3F84|nr:hypothetical protein [Halomonas sp. S2151]KJZ13506.1 hypothetical protein TW86_11355 [Halomonas sp. S2151]
MKDTYITPEKKARWGFGGSKDKITIGSKPAEKAEPKAEDEPKAAAKGKQAADQGTATTK